MTRVVVVVAILLDALLLWLPPGLSMLDARPGYGAADALAYLEALGPPGRRAYAWHEVVDFGFIATYTMLLRALGRWLGIGGPLLYAPAVADVLETGAILVLCLAWPSAPRSLAAAAGVMTALKWAGLGYVVVRGAAALILRPSRRW